MSTGQLADDIGGSPTTSRSHWIAYSSAPVLDIAIDFTTPFGWYSVARHLIDSPEPADLVSRLGTDEWEAAREELDSSLDAAGPDRTEHLLEAVIDGFDHDDPQVRKWCVALMDHHATESCIDPLREMLHDPRAAVRRHAVHSIGCQSCKADPLDLDIIDLLIERVRTDSSIRVRRAATHMLGNQPPDERARAFLADLSERASDETLQRNADWAHEQHATD